MRGGGRPGRGRGPSSLWADCWDAPTPRWRPGREASLGPARPLPPSSSQRPGEAPVSSPPAGGFFPQGSYGQPVPWPTHRSPEAAGPCGGGGREGGGEPERDRPEVRGPGRVGRALPFASCWEVLSPSVVLQPRKERKWLDSITNAACVFWRLDPFFLSQYEIKLCKISRASA